MTSSETQFLPPPRALALAAIAFFLPVAVSFAVAPDARWADYLGVGFHLCLFMLVPWLPAPSWAKAAGYGWLVLDVTSGAMSINGLPDGLAQPVRLGGHVFAGLWLIATSLTGSLPIKIFGVLGGVYLFSFTFVSAVLPMKALGPASILLLIWLGIIAFQNGTSSAHGVTRGMR